MVFVPALTENCFLAARNDIDYTLPKFIEVMFAIKPVFPLLLSVGKYGMSPNPSSVQFRMGNSCGTG